MLNPIEAQKFIHDLRNSLNTISINSALIRRLHRGVVEPEILDRIDTALREAEQLMKDVQRPALTQLPPKNDKI